jgi:multidrug resistance efflux pump
VSRMYEALSSSDREALQSKTRVPFEGIEEEPLGSGPLSALKSSALGPINSSGLESYQAFAPGAVNKSPHAVRKFLMLGFGALALVLVGAGHALRESHGGIGSELLYGAAFEGTIRPAKEIRITAESLGTISEIYAKVGDAVKKGQPLLRIDDREARIALENATLARNAAENSLRNFRAPLADVNARVAVSQRQEQQVPTRQWRDSPERAQAAYDQAVSNQARAKELFQAGLISKQELDIRTTELRIAQDDLENAKTLASASDKVKRDQSEQADLQARAARQELQEQLNELELKYKEAQQRMDATEIRAAETGVVTEVSVRLGDRVPEGSLLVRLAELNNMIAEIPVAANMISQLRVGQQATVQLPSSPAQQVEGSIRTISPLPSTNMTHLVEVEFKNPTQLLLAGQPTEVRFVKP